MDSEKYLKPTSRRDFLRQASCAAVGTVALTSTIRDLRLINAALAQGGGFSDYKALVCVFLAGGNDSNNTLIPYSGTARTDYVAGRGALAIDTGPNPLTELDANQLSTVPAEVTAADPIGGYLGTFAVHPQCGYLREMFNNDELAFVANVGTLVQPGITRANYATSPKPPQLFSHSDQVTQWQSSVPDQPFTSGWGGRMADVLDAVYNTGSTASMSISIAGVNSFEVSSTGAVTPYVMRSSGVVSLSGYGTNYASAVNNTSQVFVDANYKTNEQGRRLRAFEQIIQMSNTNLLENAYNGIEVSARATEGVVGAALSATTGTQAGTDIDAAFAGAFAGAEAGITANTDFTNQMKLVARLIAGRTALNNNRQIFFVQLGGFDTHTTQIPANGNVYATGHTGLMNTLSRTLKAFRDSLNAIGTLNNVVTCTASDFTRPFTANKTDSTAGSDHAWGGHAMVMGGSVANGGPVRGGRIYGKYPPLKLGAATGSIDSTGSSGRWIPSTSVDQYAAVLANWLGVTTTDLATVFPNLPRFTAAPFTSILTPNQAPNLGFLA